MLLQIIRLIKGYVEFEAKGRFPERFINLTAQRGVGMWDAKPIAGGISGKMLLSDYKRLRPIAKIARLRPRVKARHGLPFVIKRHRGRFGLPMGAALGALLIAFLSQFVWTFEINGNKTVGDSAILEALSKNGLSTGTLKAGADIDRIKRETLLQIRELGWLSINMSGCNACVEVREKAPKPEVNTHQTPRNIKAGCDGVITDMKIREGECVVKKGSGVLSGDLLVSGVVETKQETVRYVSSDADIFADVHSVKELKLPLITDYSSLSENKTQRKRFMLLNLSFPFTFSTESYEQSAYDFDEERFELNGVALPAGIKTETDCGLSTVRKAVTPAQAKKAAENLLMLYELFEKGESRFVGRNLTVKREKDGYYCAADYIFNENIAEPVDFSVEEE